MKNTNINLEELGLSQEVTANLKKYNNAIDGALAAAQKLEAICVTAHLAELFGVNDQETAQVIKNDYLQTA